MDPSFSYPWPKYKAFTVLISRKFESNAIVEGRFANLYKSELQSIWIINDLVGNRHRIKFEANTENPKVTDGWIELREYYSLEGSCIFKMRYLGSSIFDFSISRCDGKDVDYNPRIQASVHTPLNYAYGSLKNHQDFVLGNQDWVPFNLISPINEGPTYVIDVNVNEGKPVSENISSVVGPTRYGKTIPSDDIDHVIDMDISDGSPPGVSVKTNVFDYSDQLIPPYVDYAFHPGGLQHRVEAIPNGHPADQEDDKYVEVFKTTISQFQLKRWELRIPVRVSRYLRKNRRRYWILKSSSGNNFVVKVNYPPSKKDCTFGAGWKKFFVMNNIEAGSELTFRFISVQEGVVEVELK